MKPKGLGAAVPLLALLAAALVPAPAGTAASLLSLPCLCPFRLLTGIPCPGCGITRAVVCCAHGQWSDAVRFHPLGPLVFGALVLAGLCALQARPALSWRRQNFLAGLLLLLLLLVWALRLAGWLPLPPG